MASQITVKSGKFFVSGQNGGFSLQVDVLAQITRYNGNKKYLADDLDLYNGFANINNNQNDLSKMIDRLIKSPTYRLQRRPPFNGSKLAPHLTPLIQTIKSLPVAGANTVGCLAEKFICFNQKLSKALNRKVELPETTLSKLLHFIKPDSIWIVDSRVLSILGFWGYSRSFSGFSMFLKDLYNDPNFAKFDALLQQTNNDQCINPQVPYTTLKLIDNALWTP